MQAEISGQPMIIVLLDSAGKLSRIGDANRIRKWIEYNDVGSLGENVSG
jgi:D-alanyl-D-alanine endopeptidase (penicillin-binding protein 7)